MSGNAPQWAQTESRDASGRIDALCDRFEAAWKAGREPAISAFFGSADDPQPAAGDRELLVELIKLDLWYRWRPATGATVATQS